MPRVRSALPPRFAMEKQILRTNSGFALHDFGVDDFGLRVLIVLRRFGLDDIRVLDIGGIGGGLVLIAMIFDAADDER